MTSLLSLALTLSAQAHPAKASAVELDIGVSTVGVHLEVPRDQLEMATSDLGEAALATYVVEHLQVVDDDGALLVAGAPILAWGVVDEQPHLLVDLELATADGGTLEGFTLRDDVVLHQVVSHKIFVSVVSDPWMEGSDATLIGVLRYGRDEVVLDRKPPAATALASGAFVTGAEHILVGPDHLLFLLTLLLVAPMRIEDGRWRVRGSWRDIALATSGVITAFTVGHTTTLFLAATGVVHPPMGLIEVAIAASIGLGAIHAIRPLWRRAELVLALGFGLVHGLAFAEDLVGLGIDLRSMLWTLLGFNLGVEAVQLVLAAAFVPLVALAHQPRVARLRPALAWVALAAATFWTVERLVQLA